MRYSILSRFQGALLGSALGENLAEQSSLGPSEQRKPQKPSGWGELQRCLTDSLIHCGQLDLWDWLEGLRFSHPALVELKQTLKTREMAIALLPIALFFHDRRDSLQEGLSQAIALWQHPQAPPEDLLIWGDAIALALSATLSPSQFLPQLLTQIESFQTPLKTQLQQVQTFVDRGLGLHQVATRLLDSTHNPSTDLALAIYCFACTPEDVSLILARAAQTRSNPQFVAALAGAIAGTYNSLSGFPLRWRQDSSTQDRICQQGEALFAAWGGAYCPKNNLSGIRAIAGTGVMQPRSSLKIISQKSS